MLKVFCCSNKITARVFERFEVVFAVDAFAFARIWGVFQVLVDVVMECSELFLLVISAVVGDDGCGIVVELGCECVFGDDVAFTRAFLLGSF